MILPPDININQYFHPDDLKILEKIEKSERIIYQKESYFNKIAVTENHLGRFLKFDDSYQSGIFNAPVYKGDLPYVNYFLLSTIINPDIKNILILGLGNGNLAQNFIKLIPGLKKLDIVEIDPDVAEAAKTYFNFQPVNPINLHIQDARVFVRNSKDKYDLIILDIFTSTGLPYRFLTKEFLQEINNILDENGILTANLFGIKNINSDQNLIFKTILHTYKSVFTDTMLFPTSYGNHILYKNLVPLKHDLPDLTNIIIFASKNGFNITKDSLKAKYDCKHDTFCTIGLKNITKYIEDLHIDLIDTQGFSVFQDSYEKDIEDNLNNLTKYLKSN